MLYRPRRFTGPALAIAAAGVLVLPLTLSTHASASAATPLPEDSASTPVATQAPLVGLDPTIDPSVDVTDQTGDDKQAAGCEQHATDDHDDYGNDAGPGR